MLSGSKIPTLYMEYEDFVYIRQAVDKAGFREVGGLGIIVLEDGQPTVRFMRLLKQEISSGEVEWAEDAHAEYLTWLYTSEEDGGAGFEGESYGLYSWHSHGNMGVFYSGTDEDFIRRVGAAVPYIFSTVFNTKGEFKNRLDVWSTFECEMLTDQGRKQVTWDHDNVRLSIIPHPEAISFMVELETIEDGAEKEIETLKKEVEARIKEIETARDEACKPSRLALTEIHKKCRDDVKSEVDDHFRVYVKNAVYGGFTRPTNRGGTNGNTGSTSKTPAKNAPKALTTGTQGGQSQQASTSTTKRDGTKQGKDNNVTETKGSEDIGDGDIRDLTTLRAYDTTARKSCHFTIRQILEDHDIAIIDHPPKEVLARLSDVEVGILETRATYEDYFDEKIKKSREESRDQLTERGGYR